ncbi:di-heme-cytochrome C peroxidase [Bradyrhizobium sp. BWA-3-5]|uniref:di-heme-cytochrome C peroxidase n=1 Tax=Bradyrhizobium sp. BWA-3-5 TaxID=3080013 RepID=UPI00293E0F61|nr:di-heme-cytochrome C peroxidase [Bradyrhizobium sp. BWA-3-5]WOH66009.1 di-heme-cytochrome C peroxidase [Bradyrhizobium sp. BWA-3-5]
MRGWRIAKIVGVLVILVIGYAAFKDDIAKAWQDFHVRLVEHPTPKKTVWLDQGITKEKLSWFYHADQGTRTFGFPYEWFMALEQPTISWVPFTRVGLLSDPAYLDRYGFIADTIIPGKEALPIGFAKGSVMLDPTGAPWKNPRTKQEMYGVGLTCAACHTGSFTYNDTAVVIDGGPALTNLFGMKQGMGISLALTRYWPGRFDRFADRILGPDSTIDDRETLKTQLDQVLAQYKQVKDLEERVAAQSILEGYGRLDALNRIGNQVFSLDLKKPENYAGSSAPVHFPRIWNTPWFDWVQYNGSIMQPMVRNAGESLGVSAELNLTEPSKGLYKSSVNLKKLFEMEQMMKGDTQPNAKDGFPGLKSPKWPADILPAIDQTLAAQGAELYKIRCQGCHRPPVTSEAFWDFNNKDWWTKNQAGEAILKVENIKIAHIGTDPAQAADMLARKVAVPEHLGIKDSRFAFALGELVEKTVNYIYDNRTPPTSPAERKRTDGYMPNELRGELAYKVRPLNGVWATPPYLHNGSVPTIDDLLGDPEQRPKKFYLGSREYDPVKLGYKTDPIAGGFELDTSIRGNSNRGHEFRKDYDENKEIEGVIGPALSADERKALIEYLKTL